MDLSLLIMYTAKRRAACRMEVFETPGAFGKGWRGDKEAESEFPTATCDADLKHAFPCESLGSRLFRTFKARRRACRVGVLGTFEASQDAKEEGQGGQKLGLVP